MTKAAKKKGKRDKNGRKLPVIVSKDLPMRRFIENVDEGEFERALEAQSEPKFALFLSARADPAYRGQSFAALCKKFGITLQDVDELWRNHQLHTGMIQMMNHVPRILQDVAEDSKSKDQMCPKCEGLKTISDGEPPKVRNCPLCKGIGEVRVAGDKNSRDLVFESIGLIGKKSPMFAIQQNFGLDSGLEEILMNTQRVISGEVKS